MGIGTVELVIILGLGLVLVAAIIVGFVIFRARDRD
jgi:hypothetical protein